MNDIERLEARIRDLEARLATAEARVAALEYAAQKTPPAPTTPGPYIVPTDAPAWWQSPVTCWQDRAVRDFYSIDGVGA